MKQLESKLQQSCVEWFGYQYPNEILFAIPNGGSRNRLEAARLKREGVKKGVADLFLAKQKTTFDNSGTIVVYGGLFIEMKYADGRQSKEQKDFEKHILPRGYRYEVCRTFEDFRGVIEWYIGK
jgi:hypothetical protein